MARLINEEVLLDMIKTDIGLEQEDKARMESLIGTAACYTGVDTDIFSENYNLRKQNIELCKENEELLTRVDKLIAENEELLKDNKSATTCFDAVKAHNVQLRKAAEEFEKKLKVAELERDARGEALEQMTASMFKKCEELENLQQRYDVEAAFEVRWREKYTEVLKELRQEGEKKAALKKRIEQLEYEQTIKEQAIEFWRDLAQKNQCNATEYKEVIEKLRHCCSAALGYDWDE